MDKQRVILKQLRIVNGYKIKEAATLVGRSAGWLSEIESHSGASTLRPKEYERIYHIYNGDRYKKQFGVWLRNSAQNVAKPKHNFDGAIYHFLRTYKAKVTQNQAAKMIGVSTGYLSKIENGEKRVNDSLKAKILAAYGYKVSSFRNFATADKRAKSVPTSYRLSILIRSLRESEIEALFEFALTLSQKGDQLSKT